MASPGQGDAPTITVMTYNIHHCNPPSKPGLIDVEAIAAVIRRESPDFVALQEVDVHTVRSGEGLHQARKLAKLTHMHFHFAKAPSMISMGGEPGTALKSPPMTTGWP